jgi:serine/threonine protein kinase/tetratricopeptide (TPR) repeat protein
VCDRGFGHRGRVSGTRGRPLRDDRGRRGSACGEHSPVGFAERFAEMKSVSYHRKARIFGVQSAWKLMRNSLFLGQSASIQGGIQWQLSKPERLPRRATGSFHRGYGVVSRDMPSHRESVDELFGAALELAPAARSAFLDRECGDPQLRRAVEELLAAHDDAGSFLAHPVFEPATSDAPGPSGVIIGPYHLLELIGQGGMGEVWRAEQKQPVRRRVAIKLIKIGMDTREVVARFESERQALALMDHPAIAKVFDAGSTPEGRPYFVMEYVAGMPITAYCDKHKLTTRQRLELFIDVCEGVQHAHHKAIIHRDLKPSNILVSEVSGKAMPRIIDFGVGKATSQQLSAGTVYTRMGAIVGTLGYMSPEQADSAGHDIDTRTDVYSLGAVLYELLVGALPLEFQKLAYDEVLRRLRELDAPRPSTRLLTLGDDSTITARNRGSDLRTLARQLRGDPDAIALKALEKDRARRYATPSELAADIGRYLRNEPVIAHPPGVGYRVRKYFRRHRLGVAVAGGNRKFHTWNSDFKIWVFVGLAAVTLVVTFLALRLKPKATTANTILVSEFENTTGDSVFDGGLRQALSAQLEQSPFLRLLSDEKISQTMALMSRPKDSVLDRDIAMEVCQRTASAAVLDGSISQIGKRYLLSLKAIGCAGGESLASLEAQAADKDHILDAVGSLASQIRPKLGESLSSVQRYDAPPANVTTSSLPALKAYSRGMALGMGGDLSSAQLHFRHAIDLDPNFPMAYLYLGVGLYWDGDQIAGKESISKAYALRDRTSERERLSIEAKYHTFVLGDLLAAERATELLLETFPRDQGALNGLCSLYEELGNLDRMLAACQQALEGNPTNPNAYATLVNAYLVSGQPEKAKATLKRALSLHLEHPSLHRWLYYFSVRQGDQIAEHKEVSDAETAPEMDETILFDKYAIAVRAGHFATGRDLVSRLVECARRRKSDDDAAAYQSDFAIDEAMVGNGLLAQKDAKAGAAHSQVREVAAQSSLAAALAGDTASADRSAIDLGRRFPTDTSIQSMYLPTIRGSVELVRGDAADALRELSSETPYTLSTVLSMLPTYVRGNAYLAAARGGDAAAEFNRIIDHPGISADVLQGALAHLGLARAYALQGETAKAKRSYQDFFRLWANADPDIPILRKAKAEYARL